MSPDQIDALEPVLEGASKEIRLLFLELRNTRLQMKEGFERIEKNCLAQQAFCSADRKVCKERTKELEDKLRQQDIKYEVSKAKVAGATVVLSAIGGGLALLFNSLLDVWAR
jgi:hypothetical protein